MLDMGTVELLEWELVFAMHIVGQLMEQHTPYRRML
jgi:hypothetical protein